MNLMLLAYANEPCRICGKLLTKDDILTAVFAGYSRDSKSRAAHKECCEKYPPVGYQVPNPKWIHQ